MSRGGPLATAAYLKQQSWYYDLARNWKGGFVYQKVEEGRERQLHQLGFDRQLPLVLWAALKSLYVTGKKPCSTPPLNHKEAEEVIAVGRDFYPVNGKNGYEQCQTDELLAGLSSWSPAVRKRSAPCWAGAMTMSCRRC